MEESLDRDNQLQKADHKVQQCVIQIKKLDH